MVWIEKYRPKDLDEIVGQEQVVAHLKSWALSGTVPHSLLFGPHGTGKSVAVECLAKRLYGELWEENTTIIKTGELFGQGKSYLEANDRFNHLYKKEESLITNFKYIVKWYASILPLNAPFKLMVFEEAAALTHEAQQALRRIMEQFSITCRFLYCTTNPSSIIPAINSRCYPLFFGPLSEEGIRSVLDHILREEKIANDRITQDDIDLVIKSAYGDLRRAIMFLQVFAELPSHHDLSEITMSETTNLAGLAIKFLREKDLPSAQKMTESLLIDYGLAGQEVLEELSRTIEKDYNDPRLAIQIAATDEAIVQNGNDFTQLNALLAQMLHEVFDEKSTEALR